MTDDGVPSLCVVVPAFNEEANLPGCLAALHKTLSRRPASAVEMRQRLEAVREELLAHGKLTPKFKG